VKKRYFRDRLRELFKFDEPPHRLALAFALGVFVAFSPWIGLHIASAFFLAWALRLNKVVVLTASFINNPWTIVPMYAFCLWFGVKITGGGSPVPAIDWKHLEFRDVFSVLKPFLVPYLAGTMIVGTVAAVLAYLLFFHAVGRYRKSEQLASRSPNGDMSAGADVSARREKSGQQA
jgi:uncharacterized protein (DUF2062 family)